MKFDGIPSPFLCFFGLIGVLLLAFILSIWVRQHYAKKVRDALARGAFDDLNTPAAQRQSGCLIVFLLMGLTGFILVTVFEMFFASTLGAKLLPLEIFLPVLGIFGLMYLIPILIILVQINRRL